MKFNLFAIILSVIATQFCWRLTLLPTTKTIPPHPVLAPEIESSVESSLESGLAHSTSMSTLEIESSVESYLESGLAHLEQRQYRNAIADYTKAIELDPINLEAYQNRAEAFFFRAT